MIGRKKQEPEEEPVAVKTAALKRTVTALGPDEVIRNAEFASELRGQIRKFDVVVSSYDSFEEQAISTTYAVVAWYPTSEQLDSTLDVVIQQRERRGDGTPPLVIVSKHSQLTELGDWLLARAAAGKLEGIRLMVAEVPSDALSELSDKLTPVTEPNVIAMPVSPEVENSPVNYFFAISSSLRRTVQFISELAENNVERLYLLGGPGSGKTSLAYYYWLKRNRGRFVAVNLNSESTGDKAAMKSLICGHVTGAFPGASGREGAFSFAEDGVAFLDESHGVTGVLMQVLMEALDSGQYLPFGATKKRALECAVLFASNRSWEVLREEINIDEHARLGVTLVPLDDVAARREDMIAGIAISLSRFKAKCSTWVPPDGLTEAAWKRLLSCPWRGNMRTVIRCMETAMISHATSRSSKSLLDAEPIEEGIALWEPDEHQSYALYPSYN